MRALPTCHSNQWTRPQFEALIFAGDISQQEDLSAEAIEAIYDISRAAAMFAINENAMPAGNG